MVLAYSIMRRDITIEEGNRDYNLDRADGELRTK
jgi:hypothetical protein